jgi:hypothetical protein
MQIINDAIDLFRPHTIPVVRSSEPREYRLTPIGRELLAEAIMTKQLEWVVFVPDSSPLDGHTNEFFCILFGTFNLPGYATTIMMEVRATGNQIETAHQVARLVKQWFVATSAAAGWVSLHAGTEGDSAHWRATTTDERERNLHNPHRWSFVSRFLRGVFWGNAISSNHCQRLGGVDRISEDAPVRKAELLGTAMWLEPSKSFPADVSEVKQLAEYLSPLLAYTRRDQRVPPSELPQPDEELTSLIDQWLIRAPKEDVEPGLHAFPVRYLSSYFDGDIVVNIHLDKKPWWTPLSRHWNESFLCSEVGRIRTRRKMTQANLHYAEAQVARLSERDASPSDNCGTHKG